MAVARGGLPYFWTTWITPFLAGERSCEWSPWFQSRHTEIAEPEDRSFDLRMWTAEHNAMVHARAAELKEQGWTVYLEDQNDFKLKGSTGILSGKADIVAARGFDRLVVDCKTGREYDKDVWQVIIYLYAIPRKHPAFVGYDQSQIRFTGEVQYKKKRVAVPALTETQKEHLFATIRRFAGDVEPERRPSFKECRGCKISKADCPVRVETEEQPTEVREF